MINVTAVGSNPARSWLLSCGEVMERRWFFSGARSISAWNNARRTTWGLPRPVKLESRQLLQCLYDVNPIKTINANSSLYSYTSWGSKYQGWLNGWIAGCGPTETDNFYISFISILKPMERIMLEYSFIIQWRNSVKGTFKYFFKTKNGGVGWCILLYIILNVIC